MPDKEEIEQYKIRLNNRIKTNTETISESTTSIEEQEILLAVNNDLEGALKLIEQLEAEKTAVINETETKIEELEDTLDLCEADGKVAKYKMENLKEQISDLKEILELMKGKNNEL